MLKSCSKAYVLFSLEWCATVFMSSAESHLGLLDSIVRSAKRFCENKLCCLEHRRKVSVLCLLYEIYHKLDHLMKWYLNNFAAVRNTKSSSAPGELVLVISSYRTV